MPLIRTKRVAIGCGVVAVLGVAGSIGFALGFEPLVKRAIVTQAREKGVLLEPGELGVGLGWVELVGSHFKLVDVRGVTGSIKRFEVELSGISPKRVTIKGMDVDATGPADELAGDLSTWVARYRKKLDVPIGASAVGARWRSAPGDVPAVELASATVTPDAKGTTVDAPIVALGGAAIGPLRAALTAESASVSLGLGGATTGTPPLSAEIHFAGVTNVDLTLTSVDVSGVSTLLHAPLPLEDVKVDATLHAELPGRTAPITGKLAVDLHGFVPPHPRELDGIVFGKTTHVETAFAVPIDRGSVVLSASTVRAGAFKLSGGGLVSRQAEHARIQLELRGNIACAELATSAATSHLGSVVGAWVATAAQAALSGSVGVVVKLDADTRHLADAKVLKTIGIGCGLRPLALPSVPLPDFQVPALPPLPKLQLPGLGAAPAAPAASAR